MAATSKSPRAVLIVGHLIGKLALPDYAHKYSPKTYTQPQLFACLVLKEFLHRDYRGIEQLLKDTPDLRAAIELQAVPDHSTLQKAADRLLPALSAGRLMDMTLRLAQLLGKLETRLPIAAMDGTGLESHHASAYYVRRKAKGQDFKQSMTYRRFPKAGIVCDCKSHLILSIVPGRGPGPDVKHFHKAFDQAQRRIQFATLAADAGYDAEHIHEYARTRKVRTLIPPLIGRPTAKPPRGYWRRMMKRVLPRSQYGQRWQAETTNSMLKRLLGSSLRARTYWSQCRELILRALTLNTMILRRRKVFDRAFLTPFLAPAPHLFSPSSLSSVASFGALLGRRGYIPIFGLHPSADLNGGAAQVLAGVFTSRLDEARVDFDQRGLSRDGGATSCILYRVKPAWQYSVDNRDQRRADSQENHQREKAISHASNALPMS